MIKTRCDKGACHIISNFIAWVLDFNEGVKEFALQWWPISLTRNGYLECESVLEVGFKDALTGLTQCLATENPLKVIKNAFYFTSKAFFVLKVFRFLTWLFGHVSKQLDKKDKVNFKLYEVTVWLTNNRNTDIVQYFKK